MEKWIDALSSRLAQRTSRRGVIGLSGRALLAVSAAIFGMAARSDSVAAACSTCGGGGCSDGVGRPCGGTGNGTCYPQSLRLYGGNCTTGGNCNAAAGLTNGWVWYCCDPHLQIIKCQDCCDSDTSEFVGFCQSFTGSYCASPTP